MITKILVVIAAVAVVALIVGGVLVMGRASSAPTTSPSPTAVASPAAAGKLESTDETVGTGAEAVAGKKVTVNYRGTLADGTEFDSSYKRNQPFDFTLGAGEVIKGWDEGVAGMKVGGKRKLVIPPDMAYGPNGQGSIPANATLTFEVELLNVQ